jgi:hypothetical protein
MTDWIEHTTNTCPVDPETVVEVRYRNGLRDRAFGKERGWGYAAPWDITHYRIITPAKPPEPEMTATNEQIKAEAERRARAAMASRSPPNWSVTDYVIEVVREGWTPPPVDPDLLAFREWGSKVENAAYRETVLAGEWDHGFAAKGFVAGARYAREQEQERAGPLVEYVETDARRLDGVGSRALKALAKHRGRA